MADAYKELVDWSGGVISSMSPDKIPDNAISQGINTAFVNVGDGHTAFGTRPGLHTVNTSALDAGALHYQHPYSYTNGVDYTTYLATCSTTGKLYYKDTSDAYTAALAPPANFPAPASLCFTAGTDPVDGVVFNNRLVLVNNLGERRSLIDQTYVPWGLSPIASITPSDVVGGNAAMPIETYDLAVTSYHSTSGGESSSSTVQSVTLSSSNHRIEVLIAPTAAESAQYTHWRVYLRRNATQSALYQVLSVEDLAGASLVTDGNIPIGTLTAYLDLTAAQIAALTTGAPSTVENNGPPASMQHVVAYGRRLVASDGRNIYWSKADKADNFDPRNFEPIDTGEGDEIRALHLFSDDLLLVFLDTAVWGVFGSNPQTWAIKAIDLTVGIRARSSIVSFSGRVGWWDANVGPVIYDGTTITRIGQIQLGTAAVTSDLNVNRAQFISAGHDVLGSRILWACSSIGATTNNRIIPFNYQLSRFEASYWQAIDAASLSAGIATDGTQHLFVGGYYGQSFYFDSLLHTDGVPSGTTSGTFLPVSPSVSTLTGTDFYAIGSNLVGRYVVITDDAQRPIDRRYITSNTSTTLTLDASITDLDLSTTYSFYIGGPDFQWYGKWIDHEQPFLRKRFDRLFYHIGSDTGISDTYITTQLEFVSSDAQVLSSGISSQSLWDDCAWDTCVWATSGSLKRRLFIGRNSTAIRPVFYCFRPGREIVLYKIALLSRLLSDRYYD